MGRGSRFGLLLVLASLALSAAIAAGETTHVYPVTLKMEVDRAAGKLDGTIETDAPSEFCDSSTIRVRELTPGKDRIVARVTPYGGEWHMKSTRALRGARVYAEVSRYHLPSRPVECLEARSNTVTAP